MHLMWLHTCFHERTFVERQTYEVLIEKDKEVVGNKLSRIDFFMTPIDSGLQIYVSVGLRFVGFVFNSEVPKS